MLRWQRHIVRKTMVNVVLFCYTAETSSLQIADLGSASSFTTISLQWRKSDCRSATWERDLTSWCRRRAVIGQSLCSYHYCKTLWEYLAVQTLTTDFGESSAVLHFKCHRMQQTILCLFLISLCQRDFWKVRIQARDKLMLANNVVC